MFGKMCRRTIRNGGTPTVRAATMKSRPRTASTWPRVRRAYPGMATIPMAIIAFWICGPSDAVIAIASTSAGNASSASMTRIASRSNVPPR